MKKYGNLEMLGNSVLDFNIDPVSEWPTAPKLGRVINYNNRLYLCVATMGTDGLPSWIPLTVGIGTYVQNQSVPASSWVVNHGLNYRNPMVQVYDDQNDVVLPDQIESLDENSLVIHFSLPVSGRAVVISPVDAEFTSPVADSNYGTELPATNLYNGRKFTVIDDGTYYYDLRLSRWVKATINVNVYDIGFLISGTYNQGDTDSFGCPRSIRVNKSFNGSTAQQGMPYQDAVINIAVDQGIVGRITFSSTSAAGVFSSDLTNDFFIQGGQIVSITSVSGMLVDLNVILSTELLGS